MKPRLFAILCLLSLLSGPAPAAAEYDPSRQFSPDQLREDFALLRKALQTTHPGLNRYVSDTETQAMLEQIAAALDRPRTEREFFALVSRLSSVIRCGHTRFLRSHEFYEGRDQRERYLPLELRRAGNRWYVYRNLSGDATLEPATEVVRINGRAVSALVETMLPHVPGDGSIRTGRLRTLERNFGAYYAYLIEQPERYRLEMVAPGGRLRSVELEPDTLANMEEIERQRYPGTDAEQEPALRFELRETPRAAILTIRSFGRVQDAEGNDYDTFLENSFTRIREAGIEDLIVDLRGNGGGRDTYGSLLFSYLSDRDFRYYDYLGVVAEAENIDFQEHTTLPPDFKEQLGRRTAVDETGRRVAVGHPNLEVQKPKQPGFTGRVQFLIDGGSFSATAEFAAVARQHQRGPFIGEETGGGYHGNTSGMSYRLTLPHTRLQVSIPMVEYVSAVDPHPLGDRGILPDFRVEPTIDDLLSGADPVMRFALSRVGR